MATPPIINRPAPPAPPLASKGRILAIKLMPDQEAFELDSTGPQGNYANVPWYGLRAVLSVEAYLPKVQSTIFYGPSLYMLQNDVGIFDKQTGFVKFMDQFLNKPKIWAELTQVPIWPGLRRISSNPVAPQDPPVVESKLTMIGAGYDPQKQFWVEFQGNFFLGFPLFQPITGSNFQVAFGGGVANAGSSPLTATGFDVPAGSGGVGPGSKDKC